MQEAGINRILAVFKLVGTSAGASPERGRGHWLVLQTLRAAIGILVAAFATMVVLMLATPSVTDAPTIAKSLAQQRGTAFPGPVPPRRFVVALVATEDQRFFSPLDPGVDPVAILRVVIGRAAGFPDQGGSTIDQQLAKMLYSPGEHGLLVELERVAIAFKLNFAFSKIALLTMYAEVAYYGHGYYGLAAASCGYFGVAPADLNWSQAALLAGIVNAPSIDDPISHPSAAHAREEHVFDRLVAAAAVTRTEADTWLSKPLGLVSDHPRAVACRP